MVFLLRVLVYGLKQLMITTKTYEIYSTTLLKIFVHFVIGLIFCKSVLIFKCAIQLVK